MSPNCPDRQVLIEFLSGDLSESGITALEEHLAKCPACGDTVRGLNVHDTLLELASQASVPDPEEPGVVEQLISRLRQLPPSSSADSVGVDPPNRDVQARADEVRQKLDPPAHPDEIGRLAHYRILKLLGAGGMGVVYQAEDEQLKRLVALKVLRPSLGTEARERFMLEARAAAGIDHDHVVTIYQVGQTEELAYIAMQWLDGETLEARLSRDGHLLVAEAADIAEQIASGLAAAHAKHLIHRDIKPANIWLEADRQRTSILDFGLARVMNENPRLTETGMIAGTPAYMSPEQSQGCPVDERTDLFSLGCVLYQMLTGRMPFQASNALATLQAIQRDTPLAPHELNDEVPGPLSDLVMWLLEKVPAQRPRSSTAVAEQLQDPGNGLGIPPYVSTAASAAATVSSQSRSNKRMIRWITAALVLVAVGLGGYFAGPQIIRIATNQGQLVIQTNDRNVKVEVLEGGETIRVIDLLTEQSVDFKSGEYEVRIANDQNGFQLSDGTVTLTRGSRKIITVRKVEQALTDQEARTPRDPTRLTFKDKTSSEWIEVARRERSPEQLAIVIEALGYLGQEELSEECAKAVFQIMRLHGSRSRSPSSLSFKARSALFRMSPVGMAAAWQNELTLGNERSRDFLPTLLPSRPNYPLRDSAKPFLRELKQNAQPIANDLLRRSQLNDPVMNAWAVELLALFCEAVEFDYSILSGILPRIQQELDNASVASAIYECLVCAAPNTPGLAAHLVNALPSQDAPRVWGERSLPVRELELIRDLGPLGAPAVPMLVERLNGLIEDNVDPLRGGHGQTPGGIGGRGDVLSFSGGEIQQAMQIMTTLGSLGAASKDALPVLWKIEGSRTNRSTKNSAAEAIAKIQEAVDAASQVASSGQVLEPFNVELRVLAEQKDLQTDEKNLHPWSVHPKAISTLPAQDWFAFPVDGKRYVLLWDSPERSLTLRREAGRAVTFASPVVDPGGHTSLNVSFDEVAALKLKHFSEANMGKRVAIVIGDQVIAAPRLDSVISDKLKIESPLNVQDWGALLWQLLSPGERQSIDEELTLLVELAAGSLKGARAKFESGTAGPTEVLRSQIDLLNARARLAEHRGKAAVLAKHLAEIIVIGKDQVEVVRHQFEAGQVVRSEVRAAERALIEARIRLRQLGGNPDEPEAADANETDRSKRR